MQAFNISIDNKNIYAVYNTCQNINVISKNILREMGVEAEDETEVVIEKIAFPNGIVMNNVVFHAVDYEDFGIPVRLGMLIFNEYNVLVSYKQNKILLYNKNETQDFLNSWILAEPVFTEEGLYVYGKVEGSRETYLFNMGTSSSLYFGGFINRHYSLALKSKIPIASFFKSAIFIGGKKYKNIYFFNSLSDEDKEKYNLLNVQTDIILGYNFFQKYDLFIDNKNMKIYLE